jgi:hypothetical protein
LPVVVKTLPAGQMYTLRSVSNLKSSAEGSVLALRLVDHGDVRRDLGLIDQPIEVSTRAVGSIAGEPFGLVRRVVSGQALHLARRLLGRSKSISQPLFEKSGTMELR